MREILGEGGGGVTIRKLPTKELRGEIRISENLVCVCVCVYLVDVCVCVITDQLPSKCRSQSDIGLR